MANSQCAQDLIDTLWNVKSLRAHRELQREHLDLIDTLWNVKEKRGSHCEKCATDLIDTLWNVKESCVYGGDARRSI